MNGRASKHFMFPTPHLTNGTANCTENVTISMNSLTMHYPCPGFTSCSPYTLVLPRGSYRLEAWGAQGLLGGKGGYSSGILHNEEELVLYVYVGGAGVQGNGNGGYNGGGPIVSTYWLNKDHLRWSGGGSSDIRMTFGSETIKHKSFDFETTYFGPMESLLNRIIVAGGGGGGNRNGYGVGNETGPSSPDASSGSQTSGGRTLGGVNGGFGYGGFSRDNGLGISGGGGGYYGGGGMTHAFGGSCFVNQSILRNARMISGNTSFPSPYSETEIGHSGDGAVRITYIDMQIICSRKKFESKWVFKMLSIMILSFSKN